MTPISLRTCMSSSKVSDCTQACVPLEASILPSCLKNSRPNSLWHPVAASCLGWGKKKHFPRMFHLVQAVDDSGSLGGCLRTSLFILLGSPWMWLLTIVKDFGKHPTQFPHSLPPLLKWGMLAALFLCVCLNLTRKDAYGLVRWDSQE